MKTKIFLLVMMISGIAVGSASAQSYRHRDGDRITKGMRSRELTREERVRFGKERNRLHRMELHARRDGRISHRERRILNHQKRKMAYQHHNYKHNRRHGHYY